MNKFKNCKQKWLKNGRHSKQKQKIDDIKQKKYKELIDKQYEEQLKYFGSYKLPEKKYIKTGTVTKRKFYIFPYTVDICKRHWICPCCESILNEPYELIETFKNGYVIRYLYFECIYCNYIGVIKKSYGIISPNTPIFFDD